MKNDTINWGIISCARIADSAIIPGIKSSNNSVLYAIAGKSAERLADFANRHKPQKIYHDYENILDDQEVDAVYIPLPNSMHLEWVLKAAAKGKHILCEKPLGLNASEVLQMKTACEKNGVLLMEAFDYRHNPAIIQFKRLVDQGIVGPIKLIEGYFSIMLGSRDDIRMNKRLGGGSIYDVGSYTINLLNYLTGKVPKDIKAYAAMDKETGVDINCSAIFSYGDEGMLGMFHCSLFSHYMNGFRIAGENGIIEYPGLYHALGETAIKIYQKNTIQTIVVNCPNSYQLEIEQFARCILNGEQPLLSLEETYSNMATIDRILDEIGY